MIFLKKNKSYYFLDFIELLIAKLIIFLSKFKTLKVSSINLSPFHITSKLEMIILKESMNFSKIKRNLVEIRIKKVK